MSKEKYELPIGYNEFLQETRREFNLNHSTPTAVFEDLSKLEEYRNEQGDLKADIVKALSITDVKERYMAVLKVFNTDVYSEDCRKVLGEVRREYETLLHQKEQ